MNASPDDFDLAPQMRPAFAGVIASFAPNELAYLALTSKVEGPIRDRLAFAFHSRLAWDGFTVAREWRRVDIAVLCGEQPVALLEVKAMYTFDAFKKGLGYAGLLQDDYVKRRRLGIAGAQILTLLLATHPHCEPKAPPGVVKYLPKIRGCLAKHDDHEKLADAAAERVASWGKAEILAHDRLNGGEAFGTTVSVHYWLFGRQCPPSGSELADEDG